MKKENIIQLPFNDEIVQKTLVNTIKKYKFTYTHLMYTRTPVELLDNIFMGDLAKNALFHYLKTHTSKPVIDYDEVRTDNFKKADPGWDFKIGDRKIKVEVKSSIPPKGECEAQIIAKRDIKITASHDNGKTWIQPEDLEAYIHVQIYFYAKTYKKGYKDFDKLYRDIVANPVKVTELINVDKYHKPLFFGWSSKKKIKAFKKALKPKNTWTFLETNRVYWKCPIQEAYTMEAFLKVIDEY